MMLLLSSVWQRRLKLTGRRVSLGWNPPWRIASPPFNLSIAHAQHSEKWYDNLGDLVKKL